MKNKNIKYLIVLSALAVSANSQGMFKAALARKPESQRIVLAASNIDLNILSLPNDLLVNRLLQDLMMIPAVVNPTTSQEKIRNFFGLRITIKSIKSLTHSDPKFLKLFTDGGITKLLINRLAQYYSVNPVKVAITLRTQGASNWLKENIHLLNQSDLVFLKNEFVYGAKNGNRGEVTFLLETLPEIRDVCEGYPFNRPGSTALAYAACGGHLGIVDNLIKAGADVNHKGFLNATPLHYAACSGNIEVVKRLLDAGAKVSNRTEPGQHSPVWEAYTNGKPNTRSEVVRLLFSKMGWGQWLNSWLNFLMEDEWAD